MHKQGTWLLSLCVATGMVGRGLAQMPETPAVESAPVPVWPENGPEMPAAPEPAAQPATLGQAQPVAAPTAPEPTAPAAPVSPETKPAPVLDVAAPPDPVPQPGAPIATPDASPAPVPQASVPLPEPTPTPVATTETAPTPIALPPAIDAPATAEATMPVPRLPEALPTTETAAATPEALPELPGAPDLQLTPSPVSYLPPPAPPAPAKVANNPYMQLRQARELYGLHKYEEAEDIARRLLPLQVSWAAMNDSPRKLLEDVGRARVHATQDGASMVLAEGRRALQQGNIDEAERLAQVAELIHGPQRWFAQDDSPSKLMTDIRAARAARGESPVATTPITAPGAPGMVAGTPPGEKRTGIVGRLAARFNTNPTTPTATNMMPTNVGIEGEVTVPGEPVVKTRLPRLNSLRERIASVGHGPRPNEMTAMQPTPVATMQVLPQQPQQPGVLPSQLVNAAPRNPAVIQTGAVSSEPAVLPTPPKETAPPVVPAETAPAITPPGAVVPPVTEIAPPVTPPTTVAPPMAVPAPDPQFLQTPQMANVSTPMPAAPAAPEAIQAPQPPAAPVPVSSAPTPVSSTAECTTCCSTGEHAKSLSFCLAGDLGFMLVRPYWKTNPAAFAAVDGGAITTGREVEFGLGTQFVPELSIGLIGANNFGFRTNWWGFATSDRQSVAGPAILATAAPLGVGLATGTAGAGLVSWAELGMNVWDLEVTRDFSNDRGAVLLAGGLRYAHISQNYNALLRSAAGAVSTLRSGHNFNGIGPTLFARGRGGVGGGVYAYGEGRASLLFGRATQDAATLNADGSGLDASFTGRMLMPVGELGAGVGWRHDFDGMELFAETGLVAQVWSEVGNSSRSAGSLTAVGGGLGAAAVADHNLGLLGLIMKVGLNY